MIEDNQLTHLVCSKITNSVATITIPEHININPIEDPSELFRHAVVRLLVPERNNLCVASFIPHCVETERLIEYKAFFDLETPNIFSDDVKSIVHDSGYHSAFSIRYIKTFDRVYKMDFQFNDYVDGLDVVFESKRHFLFDRFKNKANNSLIFK